MKSLEGFLRISVRILALQPGLRYTSFGRTWKYLQGVKILPVYRSDTEEAPR